MSRVTGSPLFLFALRGLGVIVVIGVLAGVGRGAPGNVSASVVPSASTLDAGVPEPPPAPSPLPPPPTVATAPVATSASSRASAEAPVYLNQADRAELRRLPGVGPKRADAILALRERLGKFHRLEDLLRVKGIGRATLKRWRPLVRLEPPPDGGPPS